MARLPYLDLKDLAPEHHDLLARKINLNQLLAHSPEAARAFGKLGGHIRFKSKLDPRLRELAILRVGHLGGSAYETHQHRKIAAVVGLAPEKIEGTRRAPDPALYDERELLVLQATEQVVAGIRADDATFARCVSLLGTQGTMELLVTIGAVNRQPAADALSLLDRVRAMTHRLIER